MHDEFIPEFVVESLEALDRLDRDFLALEAQPSDGERLAASFRTIHSLKGASSFLGLHHLEALAHAGESLLAKLRDRTLALTTELMDALLALVDRLREILRVLEATGREPDRAHEDLVHRLTRSYTQPAEPRASSAWEVVPAPRGRGVADRYVRIELDLIDTLEGLVGELGHARDQVIDARARRDGPALDGATRRLDAVTSELQEQVQRARVQPIELVWSKLPRLVRDVAAACGKQVRLEMIGQETTLDRTIIEAIKDPLTHLVRNAIDHGIEPPAKRAAAAKPATGTLTLRAYHEARQVNIEVADDGQGLDLDAIRGKALERGLITSERASRMAERELAQLIFHAGFSTAAAVTTVSGRGVGMDVVQTNIEQLGGAVEVLSKRGVGTTITVKIPVVATGAERQASFAKGTQTIPRPLIAQELEAEGEPTGSADDPARLADQLAIVAGDLAAASRR